VAWVANAVRNRIAVERAALRARPVILRPAIADDLELRHARTGGVALSAGVALAMRSRKMDFRFRPVTKTLR
jgi:hypothetical protein